MTKVSNVNTNLKLKTTKGFGDLPDGWQWILLSEVTRCEAKTVRPLAKPHKLFSYLGLEDVASHQWNNVNYRQIPGEFIKSACIAFDSSHILYAKLRPYLNKVFIPDKSGVGSTEWIPIKVTSTYILREYLAWFLRSPAFVSYASRNVIGARMPRIRTQALWNAPVPIPFPNNPNLSLDIQHRIVSRIESLLGELKGDHQLLDKIRRDTSRFLEMKLEEIFENLPSARQPLIDVIESPPRNGWSPKCDDNPNGTPVLKLGAVLRFQYNPDEFKRTSLPTDPNAHYWLKPGDVLISRSNTLELVGHAAIYSGTPFPCIYPDLMMRIRVDQSKADSRFLVYWLQSKEVRHFIQSRASGVSPTMKKINQGHVCNIPFPVISVEEQRQLAHYLKSLQSEVNEMLKTMQQDAKLLERLEQSILEKAFQGQL